MGTTGWATRDTMVCDLPEHGNMQPNHRDPVGPPLTYMREYQVFDSICADLYDLCCFYIIGTTDDLPSYCSPWEPVSCRQVQDLLKPAQTIG